MCIFLILVILVSVTDGKFSAWNTWSTCSASCGKGVQARERIAKFEKCYSELSESKECDNRPCEKLLNLALNSSVTSSSLFLESFPAKNIIDGNTDNDFYSGTCTQTRKDNNPWVRIEINSTALIYEVVLYNRGDCCSSRLNNVVVYVGNDTAGDGSNICGKQSIMEGINMTKIKCCEPLSGHIVHIKIPGPQFLSLCEVQVYGTIINVNGNWGEWTSWSPCSVTCGGGRHLRSRSCVKPRPVGEGLKCLSSNGTRVIFENVTGVCKNQTCPELGNLAIGKVASQSSTFDSYKAELAVDGNLETESVTDSRVSWWRVDLAKSAKIYKIRLYTESSGFYLVANTTVTVGHDVAYMTSCGIFTVEGGKQRRQGYTAYDITCAKPLVGRYIQVNKNSYNGNSLGIREFEAYGRYI